MSDLDLGRPPEILDTGTPRRRLRWILLGLAVVAALVGWNLLGAGSGRTPPAALPAAPTELPPAQSFGAPDQASQLTFADASHGFLVQAVCSRPNADRTCPRRVLATADGGRSWESRPLLPALAAPYQTFAVLSAEELLFVDDAGLGSVVRSGDGGRSWQQQPVRLAGPAPVGPGGLVVARVSADCADTRCPSALAWIDPASWQLHPMPAQPDSTGADYVQASPPAPDGDQVAVAGSQTSATISVSTDAGSSWNSAPLPFALAAGQRLKAVRVYAAGGGRAYAFLQVYGQVGLAAAYGFRTDDGGLSWVDLDFARQTVWAPSGVLSGELISTDLPGRTYLSDRGGTEWAEAGPLPGPAFLSQSRPDGAVLATLVSDTARETYYVSTDGRSWSPLVVPGN